MAKFTYKGLSGREERLKKQTEAIVPVWQVTKGMAAVTDPKEIERVLARQKAEIEARIAEIEAGLDKIDKERTIGEFTFEKGKAVDVPDEHFLIPKLVALVNLGIFDSSGVKEAAKLPEPAEKPEVKPKKAPKSKKKEEG